MSFSVSDGLGDFEYSGASPNGLFAKRSHLVTPWFHRMVSDLARFNRAARSCCVVRRPRRSAIGSSATGFSRAFIERLIVPQFSAVWSADPRQMSSFPARLLAEFFDHHGMLGFAGRPQWRVVSGGSARYVEALIAPFAQRLRLRTPVRAVRREHDGVYVCPREGDAERFDEVVLATHSDQALTILTDASPLERRSWRRSPTRSTRRSSTPTRAAAPPPAGLGELELPLPAEPGSHATVTYHMNRLQSLRAEREFCVTLNRTEAIDPDRVIRKLTYAHPVFTSAGVAAQRRFDEVSGTRPGPLLRRLLGLGLPRGRRAQRGARAERFGARL